MGIARWLRRMALILAVLSPLPAGASEPLPEPLLGGAPLDLWTTAVALIEDDQLQCSGVLVGPSAVLTAGHCALDLNLAKTVVYVGGGYYFVTSGFYNSAFNQFAAVDDKNQQHDLGLLILSTPVTGVEPLPVIQSEPLKRGEAFFIFGYGSNELSGYGFGERGLFDDARGAMLVASRVKNGIIRSEHYATGASICFGDSGGPATQMFGSRPAVVGIATYTTNGEFYGTCTLGLGLSGIVDLQSKSSQKFLSYFPQVTRMSGPLALFEFEVRGIRDRFGAALSVSQTFGDLGLVKAAANQTRKEIKRARKMTKDRNRRARLDFADRSLSSIRKSPDYLSAIELAARAFLSLDQAVALGVG